ncbi:MAG TPA: hypothetical protein VFM05_11005 [Candidatus Saccharimonadales bacterium]|nr:hypothetical protein [Candidatus Saccharimonadales bacterium]
MTRIQGEGAERSPLSEAAARRSSLVATLSRIDTPNSLYCQLGPDVLDVEDRTAAGNTSQLDELSREQAANALQATLALSGAVQPDRGVNPSQENTTPYPVPAFDQEVTQPPMDQMRRDDLGLTA